MNYKKIIDITAAVNPPKYPCVFSSLSNNTVSTCNMAKFFFIVLTPAKFCASGLTSRSFLLSHDCLTKCIVLNVTKWTLFQILGCFSFKSRDFYMVCLRTPSTARAGSRSDPVWMTFSFLFMIVRRKICVLGIGLPIFAVWERENY